MLIGFAPLSTARSIRRCGGVLSARANENEWEGRELAACGPSRWTNATSFRKTGARTEPHSILLLSRLTRSLAGKIVQERCDESVVLPDDSGIFLPELHSEPNPAHLHILDKAARHPPHNGRFIVD